MRTNPIVATVRLETPSNTPIQLHCRRRACSTAVRALPAEVLLCCCPNNNVQTKNLMIQCNHKSDSGFSSQVHAKVSALLDCICGFVQVQLHRMASTKRCNLARVALSHFAETAFKAFSQFLYIQCGMHQNSEGCLLPHCAQRPGAVGFPNTCTGKPRQPPTS